MAFRNWPLPPFDWLKTDDRLKEMVDVLKSKALPEGKYKPESECKAWKGWDFPPKKASLTMAYATSTKNTKKNRIT